MAFKPVFDASNATPFKFDSKGTVLEARYMGSFDYQGDYGPTKKHLFNTSSGATIVFGQRNLIQILPSVKPGVQVRITYTGDKASDKKGRHPMKLFKVEQDESNYEPVGTVDFTPTEDNYESDKEAVGCYEAVDETPLDEEDAPEAPPARAQAPRTPARAPSAANQAKVQELLSRNRKTA